MSEGVLMVTNVLRDLEGDGWVETAEVVKASGMETVGVAVWWTFEGPEEVEVVELAGVPRQG